MNTDKSKMKTHNGIFRTQSLFLEESYTDQTNVCYCLATQDSVTKGYPSIYRLYIELADPDEFLFATTYFLDMDHWRKITESNFFKPHIERMRADLRLKIKSQALLRIQEEARDPQSKHYFVALKYLADGAYIEKAGKGRPSAAAVKSEMKKQAGLKTELDQILDRLDVPNQTSGQISKEVN